MPKHEQDRRSVDERPEYLAVDRTFVYEHAAELGAVRLTPGPRARLRFDLDEVKRRIGPEAILLDGGWQTLRVAGAAQHNRPIPWPDFLHRAEGEGTPPPREAAAAAAADDDLVRVVSVPLVADVIEPADVRAVALEHAIALGGGEEAAEFSQCPTAPLAALVRATLLHGKEE